MATGKRSKRNENTITLDDTDDEDHQQQPGPRIAMNKRRRTILDDDDDDDEVEILPQTSSGNSNRSTRSSRISSRAADALDDDDVSVSDPSSTRRRSKRSSQTLQSERSEDGSDSAQPTKKSGKNDSDVSDSGRLKIPRKSVTTATSDKGYESISTANSIINNAESRMSSPTKTSPARNGNEQQQRSYKGLGTPSRNGNDGTSSQYNVQKSGSSSNTTQSTELSKEEKLRKFLEQQQHKQSNELANVLPNPATNSGSIPTQAKNRYGAGAIQDLRTICEQFRDIGNDESVNKKLRLHIQLTSRGRVDLFGSFICTDDNDARQLHDRYDFFDTNNQGGIVLPQTQPIFPDEFPDHNPTHKASWWGIVEPTLGIGKYRSHHQQSVQALQHSSANYKGVVSATQDQGDSNKKQHDRVVTHGINISKSRSRDSGPSNAMKIENRSERSGKNIETDRRYNNERFIDERHVDGRDQRKEWPSNHGNSQGSSISRNHDRR